MARLMTVSVPHTSTTASYSWCAFTSLTKSWATMMSGLGHEVYLFAGPENEADCIEHIDCQNGYEWIERIPPYESTHPGWMAFAEKAIEEIGKRIQPGDYLCLAGGIVQQPIANAFPNNPVVEFITGYEGTLFNSYRVFPSYAWMNAVYGFQQGAQRADGRFYDSVIPHWVDMEDLPMGDGSGDYLLYVGRLTERKGLAVVRDVAQRTGMPLVVAGFGDESLIPPTAHFVGSVEPKHRAELMGNARCVIMPTLYVEPFGLVAIEAMATGTPVITPDFGAFAETVENDLTGFRCHNLAEFCDATEFSRSLSRERVRARARERFSSNVIGLQYQRYFNHLETLKGAGWYT